MLQSNQRLGPGISPEWTNRIARGDCLQLLRRLPGAFVDLVLCDLPYGITDNSWDKVIPLDQLWTQYKRILRPSGAVILTANQPFTTLLIQSNPRWFRYEWIWKKPYTTGFLNAHRMPLKQHESVLVFAPKGTVYNPQGLIETAPRLRVKNAPSTNWSAHSRPYVTRATNYPRSVIEFGQDQPRLHPTQKPVALFEYLIRTYSHEGDVVLDNCAGVGTTGVACLRSGRRYVLIEREKRFYDLARRRIAEAAEEANKQKLA